MLTKLCESIRRDEWTKWNIQLSHQFTEIIVLMQCDIVSSIHLFILSYAIYRFVWVCMHGHIYCFAVSCGNRPIFFSEFNSIKFYQTICISLKWIFISIVGIYLKSFVYINYQQVESSEKCCAFFLPEIHRQVNFKSIIFQWLICENRI